MIKNMVLKYSEDKNNEKLNEEISNISFKYRKFYDVIVICIDNLLNEDSILAIKYFQGFAQIRAQHLITLFLTKKDDNPKISDLFQFITNEFFDKRNISALKFPKNKEEKVKINNFYIKFMNYYHQIGNNEINSPLNVFNILLCGSTGVGKNTFINQFIHEK